MGDRPAQVIEGTLTILVLYRAVRRVAGAGAGLVAAAVLAVSPVTVLLNRANISDSLLILLLVLAADATTRALISGRVQSLMMAGLWVGLAFQTKMLQAWLVLPALYLAYLVAAPVASFLRRFGHVALSGLVVAVVSLSYMTAVTAVPAPTDRTLTEVATTPSSARSSSTTGSTGSRDRSCRRPDARIRGPTRPPHSKGTGTELNAAKDPPGWNRLLTGVFGRNDAWMVVPAAVAAGALLLRRRRQDGRPGQRTDPVSGRPSCGRPGCWSPACSSAADIISSRTTSPPSCRRWRRCAAWGFWLAWHRRHRPHHRCGGGRGRRAQLRLRPLAPAPVIRGPPHGHRHAGRGRRSDHHGGGGVVVYQRPTIVMDRPGRHHRRERHPPGRLRLGQRDGRRHRFGAVRLAL